MKITQNQLRQLIKEEITKQTKIVRGDQLSKGMKVSACWNAYNKGTDYYEVLGVSDNDQKYGEGGVKFNSVKEAMLSCGVSSLKQMEALDDQNPYGMGHYVWVRDITSNEEGPWLYLYHGRWVRGSGAERVSFRLLSEEEIAEILHQ